MKVLIIGSGGREHALAWKVAQSPRVTEVHVAPGNAGTALEPRVRNVDVAAEDVQGLLLVRVQVAAAAVEHAEGAEPFAFGGDERGAGVEPDVGFAEDVGVFREAGVFGCIGHEQQLGAVQRVLAE